jgi:hypothetical protein
MNNLTPQLDRLGDALERAAERDVAGARTQRQRRSRRLALAAVAVAVAIPGLAFAADRLIGGPEVARSLPAGTRALAGTNPSCTAVVQDVEYHCVLERPPAPEVADWKGTVEPTVDATKHVNGGCRSLTSDGLEWQCYIGRAAVDQQIVGAGFLGEYAPSPGVG